MTVKCNEEHIILQKKILFGVNLELHVKEAIDKKKKSEFMTRKKFWGDTFITLELKNIRAPFYW